MLHKIHEDPGALLGNASEVGLIWCEETIQFTFLFQHDKR